MEKGRSGPSRVSGARSGRAIEMMRMMAGAVLVPMLAAVAAGSDGADEANRRIGRGINLGNALEAPNEGEWGIRLEAEYFGEAKEAGFDSVRIPIRWSSHAATEAPFAIDPEFFERVDWAIDQAISRELTAIINFHHYEALYEDPAAEHDRFLALWEQVAQRYRDRPEPLIFEVLNEPHGNLGAEQWNALIPEALGVIRASNPERTVIVGPAEWNGIRGLDALELPEGDRRLIVTVHSYDPFPFTHQGAEWVDDSDRWLGTRWTGTTEERAAITDRFDRAAAWGRQHDRPLFLGEFGAFSKADMESRAAWTAFVTRSAEARGMSWAYWEFGSGFGAFDRQSGRWIPELLGALIPSDEDASNP